MEKWEDEYTQGDTSHIDTLLFIIAIILLIHLANFFETLKENESTNEDKPVIQSEDIITHKGKMYKLIEVDKNGKPKNTSQKN